MNLARHAFVWMLIVVTLVVGLALTLASAQLLRLSRDAAAARQDVMVAELGRRLDGKAASAQMLGIEADGALPSLPTDLVAAVIDQGGSVLASSSSSSRLDGEPAPARWLDNDGLIRTGHWTASAGGAAIAGAPLHDQQGNLIGALVIEDSGTAIPLLVHMLMPAVLWGLLLLVALLPACWFGARLAVGPLSRQAAAVAAMLTALRAEQAAGAPDASGLALTDPKMGFAAFGHASRELLEQFHAAVEAVSISGEGEAAVAEKAPVMPEAPGSAPHPSAVPGAEAATAVTTRASRWLLVIAAGVALCVWSAMAIAIISGEQGRLADMRRPFAEAVADMIVRDMDGPTGLSPEQAEAMVRIAGQMSGVSGMQILAPDGRIVAAVPLQAAARVLRVIRPLNADQPNGWRITVAVDDTTERDLAGVLGALLAGLAVGLWSGLELLIWMTARKLDAPLHALRQLAAAGRTGDYRLVPPSGGAGEINDLRIAMAGFIGFLTLRAREVELLLRDARHDTYDPGVVARAEAWLRHFKGRARFAEQDPSHLMLPEDTGLRRWLWYLTAMLLGMQIPAVSGSAEPGLMLAGVLAGGRLLAWLPRWLGRRPAIGAAGGAATLAVWLIPPAAAPVAAAVIATALGSVIHSATSGQTEPTGTRGAVRDAGSLAAAAAGLGTAAILTLAAGSHPMPLAPVLLTAAILAVAAFAFAARDHALEPPPRAVLPAVQDFIAVLRSGTLAPVLVGLVVTAAACVTGVVMTALAGDTPVVCLIAAALGLWAAPPVAARLGGVTWLPPLLRLLPGPVFIVLLSGLPPVAYWCGTAATGLLAGLLWRFAAVALYQAASRERAAMPEQVVCLCGGVWRGTGLLLPVGVMMLGVSPATAILTLGAASAVGAIAVLPRRERTLAAT